MAGYTYPKNLIEISGRPLIQHVMESLQPLRNIGGNFVCVTSRDENRRHHTGKVLQLIVPGAILIEINDGTSGAACSALLAVDHIDNDEPLVIVNGDQVFNGIDLEAIITKFQNKKWDAGVLVFEDIHPRWSFVKCDSSGLVVETAEKRPISKFATAGFFYFARGSDFVRSAMEMIKKDARIGGAFYICPALNEMILRQGRIGVHKIERGNYCSLSTPSDVQAYACSLNSTQSNASLS